jgi:hypothetical protein
MWWNTGAKALLTSGSLHVPLPTHRRALFRGNTCKAWIDDDHRTGSGMRRQVIDATFANDSDVAPVTQAISILGTGANDSSPLSSRDGLS